MRLFDSQTKDLTPIGQADPMFATTGASRFLILDEGASGILDASEILGAYNNGEGTFTLMVNHGTRSGDLPGGSAFQTRDEVAIGSQPFWNVALAALDSDLDGSRRVKSRGDPHRPFYPQNS